MSESNIISLFSGINPISLAFIATIFTWLCTALGASSVYFFNSINQKVFNGMLGFAAGIMISASFWSLLLPAIEISQENGNLFPWLPATVGFLVGSLSLFAFHKVLPHLHVGLDSNREEGGKSSWTRSMLLIIAITIHNLPEGLAVGVAFGVLGNGFSPELFLTAIAVAFGIGIQNIPEGAAVSIPLRREGYSKNKSFYYGQLSGMVEPIGGIIGAALVVFIQSLLPYALGFAAGAMIFVVVEELIPESHSGNETQNSTLGAIIGFTLMMVLDLGMNGILLLLENFKIAITF